MNWDKLECHLSCSRCRKCQIIFLQEKEFQMMSFVLTKSLLLFILISPDSRQEQIYSWRPDTIHPLDCPSCSNVNSLPVLARLPERTHAISDLVGRTCERQTSNRNRSYLERRTMAIANGRVVLLNCFVEMWIRCTYSDLYRYEIKRFGILIYREMSTILYFYWNYFQECTKFIFNTIKSPQKQEHSAKNTDHPGIEIEIFNTL